MTRTQQAVQYVSHRFALRMPRRERVWQSSASRFVSRLVQICLAATPRPAARKIQAHTNNTLPIARIACCHGDTALSARTRMLGVNAPLQSRIGGSNMRVPFDRSFSHGYLQMTFVSSDAPVAPGSRTTTFAWQDSTQARDCRSHDKPRLNSNSSSSCKSLSLHNSGTRATWHLPLLK